MASIGEIQRRHRARIGHPPQVATGASAGNLERADPVTQAGQPAHQEACRMGFPRIHRGTTDHQHRRTRHRRGQDRQRKIAQVERNTPLVGDETQRFDLGRLVHGFVTGHDQPRQATGGEQPTWRQVGGTMPSNWSGA